MSTGGGALGSGHQLTADREFRYIVQWFSEWSDFQREDFVPVLASYLAGGAGVTGSTAGTKAPYVNGIIGGMANLSGQDKPMSLFQCRVKLFNEWSTKWPESHREKLLERLTELDADFGHHVQRELSGEPASSPQIASTEGGDSSANPEEEFGDPGSALNENSTYYQQQQQQQQYHHQELASECPISLEPTATIAPATIALVIAED